MEVVLLSSMSTLHVRIVPCRLPVSSLSHLPGSSSSISMYAAAARPRPFVATRGWLLFALVRVTFLYFARRALACHPGAC